MNEYRDIVVGNMTYIMDEATALEIFSAMRREFGWAGVVFHRDDIAEEIRDSSNYDDDDDEVSYTDEQVDAMVSRVMSSSWWRSGMNEHLCTSGYELLQDVIGWEAN